MKLRQLLIYMILACCLCSCEYYFHPEGLDNGAKLYVQCIAGNGDRTYINIQKAMGVNAGGDIMPDVESISLKVNGKESTFEKYILPDPPEYPGYGTKTDIVVYPSDEPEYYVLKRYNMWYTDAPIKEGDQLELEVRAKGMEPVSAAAKVPEKVIIQDVKASPRCTTVTDFDYSYTESYMHFDIGISGASTEDFYGVLHAL